MDINTLLMILIPVFVLGVVMVGLAIMTHNKRIVEVKKVLSTQVFLVTLPREVVRKENDPEPMQDFRQLISVAEQMFSSFSSIYSSEIKNKILHDQEQISFEIIAKDKVISFFVSCPKAYSQMVEKQINAYYPDAHIEKVKTPNIFQLSITNSKAEISGAELKIEKKFILPIKTYQKQESDSLSGITNAMSKLGENAAASYQLIIRPAHPNWRISSSVASKKVLEGKSIYKEHWLMKFFGFLFEALGSIFHSATNPETSDQKSHIQLSPMQEATLKSLNEKSSKNGFEVAIRLISTAPDKQLADTNLQSLVASFSQFGSPELNNFKIKMGGPELIKDYILRHFPAKADILNTEELATIFHFPNHFVETPNMLWLTARDEAPPANLPTEGTIIGKSVFRGEEKEIRIKNADRQRHIFMIGKTGVGKTTLFANMIEQDIREGKGCCFIDPLGDAIEDLMGKIPVERADDLILFDPADTEYPIALNMLEFKSLEERDFLIQEAIEIFYKLFDPNRTGMVGAQWEHWFRNAAITVMSQPEGGTLIDIPRLFTDDAFRTKVVSYVTDPIVRSFWEQQLAKTADFHKSEMYNYFISKFGRFMTNDMMRNIIGQRRSSFDFREAMDQGKIILINLSKGKIGEMNSSLLGLIIVNKIQMAAFSRADIPEEERRDFYLYVDEFQNFTTDSFASILSEARKYRLNLNITNQYIAQLTEKIRDAVVGNAGTIISYRIGAADAEFLLKEFPGLSVSDMTNLEKFTTYVKLLIDGTPSRPFSMKGIKSETTVNVVLKEQLRNFNRHKHCRPLEEIQSEFMSTFQKPIIASPAGGNEPLNNA